MMCCTVNSTHTHTCVHVFSYLFACIIVLVHGTLHLYNIECNFVLMYVLLMYMYNDIIMYIKVKKNKHKHYIFYYYYVI